MVLLLMLAAVIAVTVTVEERISSSSRNSSLIVAVMDDGNDKDVDRLALNVDIIQDDVIIDTGNCGNKHRNFDPISTRRREDTSFY